LLLHRFVGINGGFRFQILPFRRPIGVPESRPAAFVANYYDAAVAE
jgi:hypothetical protein